MKYQNKTVIASKKNSNAVRVFIPEKLRINGVRYVQPYKFMRISVSGQRMMVTMRDSACFFVSILSNEVVITAPFTSALLRRYINQVQAAMATNPGAGRYLIYDRLASGTISFASPEDRAAPFLRGKGEVVPG